MAGAAIGAELTVVFILGGVTGKTVGWRAFEPSIGMTRGTSHTLMGANQFEARLAVVEMHILPVEWVMAPRTIHAHLSLMDIYMTGSAGGRRIFEGKVVMACRTGNIHMPAHQFESGLRMIEGDILPGGGFMTRLAVCAQNALMRVILLVAGETIGWRSFEDFIGVAGAAGNVDVGLGQFESRTVVIELGGAPAFRRMARSAIRP